MQVNSAQDYLTRRKRQLIAKSYYTLPPPQAKRYNSVYTAVAANNATQYQRVIVPANFGTTARVTATSFDNWCCSNTSGVPGVFATKNERNFQTLRDIYLPMSPY